MLGAPDAGAMAPLLRDDTNFSRMPVLNSKVSSQLKKGPTDCSLLTGTSKLDNNGFCAGPGRLFGWGRR